MSLFATDFVMGHFILFALYLVCLIPGIDQWHSVMLFWLRPSKQIRAPIYSLTQRRKRRQIAILYGIFLGLLMILFLGLLIVPAVVGPSLASFNFKLPI